MGILVDNFAGGGGASLGIKLATGREVDLAINHDADAIEMHEANHPNCRHFCEDVWTVDPVVAVSGREVDLAWFSPDCKHFSRAKGGKPVEKKIRGLAWVAIKWARLVRPKLIILENVREFQDWGPLIPKVDERGCPVQDIHGNPVLIPDPARRGQSFRRFVGTLRNIGYQVEWRDMNAADYGAATHRRRLFLIARCDRQSIVWPEPTHGPGTENPWHTAAEFIDWDLPCHSIFLTKEEGRKVGVQRPLVENTMQRIARGMKRFVFDCKQPFIVRPGHYSNITGEGKYFRGQSIHAPLSTVTSKNDKALIMPSIARIGQTGSNGGNVQSLEEPLRTIVSKNEHLLCAAWMTKHFGGVTGVRIDTPMPTTTARGTQNQLSLAYLTHANHGDKQWSDVREPLRTITTSNHAYLVRAFCMKYFTPNIGHDLREPLHTITQRDRFAIVNILGVDMAILDILMRMFCPRELADCQGFPHDYILTGTKTDQVARIGNSVCPPMAYAIVKANYRSSRRRAVA